MLVFDNYSTFEKLIIFRSQTTFISKKNAKVTATLNGNKFCMEYRAKTFHILHSG